VWFVLKEIVDMAYKGSFLNIVDAKKGWYWLTNRGGIAIWEVQLIGGGSGGVRSYMTPACQLDGSSMTKPHWSVGNKPREIITDPREISVVEPKEVKRFHVALRMGRQGMTMKCTDSATRKIKAAVEKAGEGAWHEFDYSTQEAVIYAATKEISIKDWADRLGTMRVLRGGSWLYGPTFFRLALRTASEKINQVGISSFRAVRGV
jgi:hypothetical protein